MQNCTLKKLNFFKLTSFIVFFLFSTSLFSQICGTPGGDGPVTVSSSVNTYYPIAGNITLNAGGQSVLLAAVPATDRYSNNFGGIPISVGDLVLIIQMQDATIDSRNSSFYGSGTANSGPDNLGGTGFTDIGNTGIFEYVIATNNVLLSGGNLTFKGTGANGGVSNSFFNADATTSRGKRTFQIVRVPQYSNLTLTKDITTPPFNGVAGGVIAFNVSGAFNFNNFNINGTARGFRGGYSPQAFSGPNDALTYVGEASNTAISGKGEGIAGTPRFMWDGYNEVNNGVEGMPGGSSGRGAPANAGGGGNDHNTGGGGGGNGGLGGLGGYGWQGIGGNTWPTYTGGGRPGFLSYRTTTPELTRLIMGGGGGAGDANNATSGVKGGVGGAIVLINAGSVQGPGGIQANGSDGAAGTFLSSSDGAGGAGAGGTVLLNISGATTGLITIYANGGNGGDTDNDSKNEHGPGGGGGGGIIRHNITPASNVTATVTGGKAGRTNKGGTGSNAHGSMAGTAGYVKIFANNEMPPNLQVNSNCFPILDTKVKALPTASACNSIDEKVTYEIQIKNTGVGNAAGVVLDFSFPANIAFDSAVAVYSAASGPSGALTNTGTGNRPLFGGFNIAQNGVVTITLIGKITGSIAAGKYSSSAQALYLDPTRLTGSDNRKITAVLNNSGGTNTKYQGANQADVPGSNFNGATTTVDDITILALPATPKTSVAQSSCAVPTGTITVTNLVNGSVYTIKGTNPVTTPISNTTGIFSGLAPNTYVVTTTNEDGCISLPTSGIVINAVAGAPKTTGASICEGDTNGALLTATSTSCSSANIKWYLDASGGVAIATGPFNPFKNTSSGLTSTSAPQTKTYYAACDDTSCRTATNFVINAKPTITGTTPVSRCDAGTVILEATASAGTINWYADQTTTTVLATGTSFTTPSLSVTTTYYVGVTDNGCTSARTAVVATVNALPTINSTTQGSRCGAGDLTLQATASAGATINWYAAPIGGVSLGTGPSFAISNLLATTTYYVGATTAAGCTTTSRIAVAAVVNTASTIVFTSGTQSPAVCIATAIPTTVYTFGGSATNAIVSNLPAGLTAAVDATVKTVTISGTPTVGGTYTITTVGHTAPCTEATINGTVTINASIPTPTTSVVTQPTCATATGSFTIINYNSSYTYTITPSTGVVQTGSTITAPVGKYKLTAKSGNCISGQSVEVVINAQPATPSQPTVSAVTQPTCATATGSFTITNYNAAYTYTVTPSTGVTQTGNTITAPAGSYKVTATLGACTSGESVAAVINVQPATPVDPTVSAVTQPTCATATGSFTITNYNAAYTYTVTPSTGVTQTGNTITAPAGSYKVTATLGVCISGESVAAVINAQPATPVDPTVSAVTQPTCATATGSFTITNYDAAYTYTVTPSTGVTQTGNTITAPAGSYKVTATLGACTSGESVAAVINVQPATPVDPTVSAVTQPTCATATGSFTITNYNAAYTYTVTPSTGVTQTGNTITAPAGSYKVTATLGACISGESVAAVINAQPATPSQPTVSAVTQPTCATATGSFTITNYDAAYTYTVTPSTGVTQTGNTITAPAGSYKVTATLGACTSGESVAAVINAQPATPSQPTVSAVTQPTCATATGSFTITNYDAAYTYTITPSTGVTQVGNKITAPAGSYKVTATLGACISGESVAAVINAQPATPSQPTVSAVIQPTCATATGSFTITNYDAAYTYTVTPSTGVTQTGNKITAPAGSYKVTATLGACISGESVAAVINAQPATPVDPTVSAVTQPTCATATGSFTITNYNAAYTYTVTPSTGVTQTGNTITAPAGSYKVTATLGACISGESVAAVINAQPATPVDPTVSVVTQPTCATATGSFTITNYNSSYTYTVTPSTGVTQTGNTITAPAGSYKVTATLGACTSGESVAAVINAQPATPSQPTVSAVTQPTCATATGSFTITNYDAAYTYTVTPSTGVTQTGNTITAPAGSYKVTATLGACISGESVAEVINAQPATPSQPTVSAVTQPTCATATGSFTITNYDAAYTYTVTPSTGVTQTGNKITAPAGSYKVTATLGACISGESVAAVINAQPATPSQPTVSAVIQPTCATATGSFTITNYDAAYTYTVTPLTGVTQVGNKITAPAGSYKVTATLGACISGESVAAVINAQPATPVQPLSKEQIFCFIDAKRVRDLVATGANIQWYNALTGGTLYDINDLLGSNTYYASQTTDGCESARIAVNVIVTATPLAGTLSGKQNICLAESTVFSSTGGDAGGVWSSSNTAVATVDALTGTITGVSVGIAKIKYTVIGKQGCDDATAEREINVNSLPTASITGVLNACLTTTLTAVSDADSPSYVWYKDNSVINGQTASTLVVTSNGDYKVKVINGLTFCEQTSANSAVIVADTEKPVITCPSAIAQAADAGKCSAVITIVNPTATDNCSGVVSFAGVRSDALLLTDAYPVGTTTITWTATDASGNVSATCTQTITVTDTEKPVITCPAAIAQAADAGKCSAVITIVNPTATDNCSGVVSFAGVRSDALLLTDAYPVGTTTITWTATDASGNVSATCTQTITVTDTEKPVITCPAAIAQAADAGKCSAVITIVNPTATDNCSGVVSFAGVRSDALLLTDAYPVGTTTITWTATDASGNVSATCTQTITVTDTEKPVITCPVAIAQAADAGKCSAVITIVNPTATDNCSGVVSFAGVRSDALLLTDAYPVGTTTITWTATDASGNVSATCTQTITVTDTEKPVITCPAAIAQAADAGKCSAVITIVNPTATDNCSGVVSFAGVRSDALLLTDAYPVGTTTITWTATDASGNVSATCTQTITVTDTEKPVITCPAAIAQAADAGKCSAVITIVNPTATDNCSGVVSFAGVRSDALLLTDAYPVGTTTITWTATDASGNVSATCTQTITVTDTEKPVITCPAAIAQAADAGKCSAVITIVNPTATDNCSGVVSFAGVRSDALLLTDAYPVGTTTITWTATDASGNVSATCTQTITVTDTEKPVITCPAAIAQAADAGKCSAVITIVNPTATDNCSGVVSFAGVRSDALLLTDAYPVGTTTITWTATDASGNVSATCTQTITVTDTEKPVITCPAAIAQAADAGKCSAVITIVNPTATDNCSGVVSFAGVRSDALLLTDAYPVGTTTITWTATDASGNVSATCTQTITVTDTEKPVITCPAAIAQAADAGKCSAVITIVNPTATDNCSGVVSFAGVRSDALLLTDAYPVGTTTITWTATDASGNVSATCTQTITVTDTEKPVITCPAAIAQAADAGKCSAVITIVNPTATDNCSGVVSFAGVRSDALLLTDAYPVGTTTITWTATDASGNVSATCTQTITVTDTEKPVITCPVAIAQAADAGKCSAVITIVNPTATDNCSGVVSFAGVRSDALLLTDAYPVGTTTITWTATDASGNVSATCTQTITVTDTEKPVITCPADVVANTDSGLCTATIVLGAPVATDNCGIASVVNDAPVAFSIGVTTVTWVVTDNNGNVSTCQQKVTVFGPIKSSDDVGIPINSYVGGIAVSSVLNNDLLNCVSLTPDLVKITLATTLPSGVNFNTTTGEVSVDPHTPSGTYTFDYTICDVSNISNCSTSTVKIVVNKPVIEAITETTDSINGITGGITPPLTSNDTLNGDKVVIGTNPGDVTLTPKNVPTGLTLNPDGTVTVAPNTPAGNYNVEYQICEVTNPSNCSTVTSVVVVGAAIIDATDDNVIFADGINGSLEVINVLDNDKLNGSKINNPATVILKDLTKIPGITLNVDGTIDVAPNTPGGTYTLTYQICDVVNRSNCVTAKVVIFVEVPSIAVVKTAVFNDENKSGYANAGETITYKFRITNTGNTPLYNITIDDQLPGLVMTGGPITLGVNEIDEHSFIGTYVIKQSDINLGKISNQATVFGTSANGITVEDQSDNLSEVDDNPTVSPIEGCVIKVFNAISPNGDSQNERFYIQGLECYPDNTVEIYNRWGVLVFERERYNNEDRAFRGFSEGRTTVRKSEGLPVGTYYYVLKYKDSESNAHQKAGYLYINK